jgi:uncharacterized protein YegJ (DUF2314 family)
MEPIFRQVDSQSKSVQEAHQQCAESIEQFIYLVKQQRENVTYMAKLNFRDPDLSEKEGSDHFFYLWLSQVYFHEEEGILSGLFFEMPKGFEKWHTVGDRLGFDKEDVFDWMVIDEEDHMKGGFTIRVTRESLKTEKEKNEYDEYIGIKSFEPI